MERVREIDIAKGVGIILVVLGHLIDHFDAPMQQAYPVIYLFHMPLFFFLSGMFFREGDGFVKFAVKKAKRLLVPFVLANVLFFFFEFVRAKMMGDMYDGDLSWKQLIYACLGLEAVPSMLVRSTWFILALFRASLLYWLLWTLSKGRRAVVMLCCHVIGIVGAMTAVDKFMIGQSLSVLPFFCMGHICGSGFVRNKGLFGLWQSVALFVLSLIALCVMGKYQLTNIAVNVYGNIWLLYVGAVVGILAVLWLCRILALSGVLSRVLSFIGRYTMAILIWHMFVMLVVSKIVGMGGLGSTMILFVAALAIPVLICIVWNKIKPVFVK